MLPEDIVNRALDAAGSEMSIGDLQEGTREAQVCLRAYAPALQQLARSAHWDCLRKTAPLTLLADATGQTPNVGNAVQQPWTYCYAYPMDCMKARYVPWNTPTPGTPTGNIAIPGAPLMPGLAQGQPPMNNMRVRPARFLVGTESNYPGVQQSGSWIGDSQWWDVPGVSPTSRIVIMTNVVGAQLVYTALIPYPNMWDSLFQEALVALLASVVALPLAKDKKYGLQLRQQNIAIAKDKITAARVSDGNEGWSNTDHVPDFIRARSTGHGRHGHGDGGAGVLGLGWDSCSFADGSAF